jgi:ABC-2 type transport system permease protein
MGMPLPFFQSLLLAWPQTVGLIAPTVLLSVVGFVTFQREELGA